jgi:hypothetical protein
MTEEIDLLREIAANTHTNTTIIIAAITALSTVAAASISAYLAYKFNMEKVVSDNTLALQKIHADIITAERLRWLKDIRAKFSKFTVETDKLLQEMVASFSKQSIEDRNVSIISMISAANEQCTDLQLLLNTEKKSQRDLFDLTEKIINETSRCIDKWNEHAFLHKCAKGFDKKEYDGLKQKAFKAIESIGVETWKKIKIFE